MDIKPVLMQERQVVISHGDLSMPWGVSAFDRKPFEVNPDFWTHLNSFWKRCGPEWESRVFEYYREAWQILRNPPEVSELIQRLQPICAKILDSYNQEHMINHLFVECGLKVPQSCAALEYNESDDRPGSREKTYLYKDYQSLAAFICTLRGMIPILGEVLSLVRQSVGGSLKEYMADSCMRTSQLWQGAARMKLQQYTAANLDMDKVYNFGMTLNHIGRDSVEDWMLARVIVRRVTVADVRGDDPRTNAISYIFSYFSQPNSSDGGDVRPKIYASGDGEDGRGSRIEDIRIREEMPPGDKLVLELQAERYVSLTQRICGGAVDAGEIKRMVDHAHMATPSYLSEAQLALVGWVLNPHIPPSAILAIRRECCINLIAVAQYWLLKERYSWLAGYITAKPTSMSANHYYDGAEGTRQRIPKEIIQELGMHYRGGLSGNNPRSRRANDAVEAISDLGNRIFQSNWELTCSPEMVTAITRNPIRKITTPPSDLLPMLAKLVIQLNRRVD